MYGKIRIFLIFPHIKIKKNYLTQKSFFTKKFLRYM